MEHYLKRDSTVFLGKSFIVAYQSVLLRLGMDMSTLLDDSILNFISADYKNADTTEFDQSIAAFPDPTHSLLPANPSPSNVETAPISLQPLPSLSSVANTRYTHTQCRALRSEILRLKVLLYYAHDMHGIW